MNDAVRKLMELADDYAMSSIQYGIFSNERGDAKDALKDELVRLFTPLSDEQIKQACKETWVFDTAKQWVRNVEKAHGIGGES